jgi:hypothetical protein
MGLYPAALALGVLVSLLFAAGQLASVPRRQLSAVLAGAGVVVGAIWLAIHMGAFDPTRISSTPPHCRFGILLVMNAFLLPSPSVPGHAVPYHPGGPNLLMLPNG